MLSIRRHSVHPKSIHYQNDVVYLTSTETASFSTFSHSLLCHPLVQWVASAVSPKFVNNTMRIWVRILLGHMFPVYYISSHHILAHDNILVVKMLLLMWTVRINKYIKKKKTHTHNLNLDLKLYAKKFWPSRNTQADILRYLKKYSLLSSSPILLSTAVMQDYFLPFCPFLCLTHWPSSLADHAHWTIPDIPSVKRGMHMPTRRLHAILISSHSSGQTEDMRNTGTEIERETDGLPL